MLLSLLSYSLFTLSWVHATPDESAITAMIASVFMGPPCGELVEPCCELVEPLFSADRLEPGLLVLAEVLLGLLAQEPERFLPQLGRVEKVDHRGQGEFYLKFLHDFQRMPLNVDVRRVKQRHDRVD